MEDLSGIRHDVLDELDYDQWTQGFTDESLRQLSLGIAETCLTRKHGLIAEAGRFPKVKIRDMHGFRLRRVSGNRTHRGSPDMEYPDGVAVIRPPFDIERQALVKLPIYTLNHPY